MDIRPLTPDRWDELEKLFGPRGVTGNCWCMYPRLRAKDYEIGRKSGGNREAFRGVVEKGPPPGLLAYEGEQPVGWIAFGPRPTYLRLQNSRVAAPVDDMPVWSVVCFVTARSHRGQGVAAALLEAAVHYARQQGVHAIEGYPIEPDGKMADIYAWWGLVSMFRKCGFEEVARRSPRRPVMRLAL